LKWIYLTILSGFLWISIGQSFAQSNFELQHSTFNDRNRTSTAFYLDKKNKRLVSKTFTWDEQEERNRKSAGKGRFVFPQRVSSMSDSSVSDLLGESGIKVTNRVYEISRPSQQGAVYQQLKRIIPADKVKKFYWDMLQKTRQAGGNYKRLHFVGKGSNYGAVYYNKEKGELLFKALKKKRRSNGPPQLAENAAISSDLHSKAIKEQYEVTQDLVFPVKTARELDQALHKIKGKLDFYRLPHFKQSLFTGVREQLWQDLRKFGEPIKQVFSDGFIKKVYYSAEENALIYEKSKIMPDGRLAIYEQRYFSLGDSDGFKEAGSLLNSEGLYTADAFDAFAGASIVQCDFGLPVFLGKKLDKFEDVTDFYFENYLDKSLGQTVIPSDERALILNFRGQQVKAFLGANGKIRELIFVDHLGTDPKLSKKEGFKIVKSVDLDGEDYFTIMERPAKDQDFEPAAIVKTEDLVGKSKKLFGHLAVYVKGVKSEGRFKYDEFEKNKYPFVLDKNEDEIVLTGRRIRLNGERGDRYKLSKVQNAGGGGVVNFLFKTFYTRSGRQEKVRSTIVEEGNKALNDDEFKHYKKIIDIERAAIELARTVGTRTHSYRDSTNRIKAVAAEETYKRFVTVILQETIKDLVTEEEQEKVDGIAKGVMDGFMQCLEFATEKRNPDASEKCFKLFDKEGPVDTARGILTLKLESNGLADFKDFATRQFNACIEERHDPVIARYPRTENSNASKREGMRLKKEARKVVQGCLYQGFLATINVAAKPLLLKQVKDIADSQKLPNLKLSNYSTRLIIKEGSDCLQEAGLMTKTEYGPKFYFDTLKRMEADDFQILSLSCVDKMTESAGRQITRKLLTQRLRVDSITSQQRPRLVNAGLRDGYDKCMGDQKLIISQRKSAFYREKERLRRYNLDHPRERPITKVGIVVPNLNPSGCIRFITTASLSAATKVLIEGAIGSQQFKELQELHPAPFISCFEREKSRLEQEYKSLFLDTKRYLAADIQAAQMAKGGPLNTEEVKEVIAEKEKELEKLSDFNNSDCLKKGMIWGARYGTGAIIEGILAKRDDYNFISLNATEKEFIGKNVSACMQEELQGFNTISDLLSVQNLIQEVCSVKLIKNSHVQKIFFDQVISFRLKSAKEHLDAEDIAELIPKIRKGIGEAIANERTLDDIFEKASTSSGLGVMTVIEHILEKKIRFNLDTDDDRPVDEKLVLSTSKAAFKSLMDDRGYRKRIEKAAVEPRKGHPDTRTETLDDILDDFVIDATRVVAEGFLKLTAEELRRDGILKTAGDVETFQANALSTLNSCFLEGRINGESTTTFTDRCLILTKNSTTIFMMRDQLDKNLNDASLLSVLPRTEEEFSKWYRERTGKTWVSLYSGGNKKWSFELNKDKWVELQIDRIMLESDAETKTSITDRISLANAVVGPKEGKKETRKVITELKLRAAKIISSELLPLNINEVLEIGPDSSEEKIKRVQTLRSKITSEVLSEYDSCLESTKSDMQKHYASEKKYTQFEDGKRMNTCINTLRLLTTKKLLPTKISDILAIMSSNKWGNDTLVNSVKTAFDSCSKDIKMDLDTLEFKYESEICTIVALTDFSRSAIDYFHQETKGFIKPRPNTERAWNRCVNGIRKQAIDHVTFVNPAIEEIAEAKLRLNDQEFYSYIFRESRKNSFIGPWGGLPQLDAKWFLERVTNCAFSNLAPNIVDEYRDALFSETNPKLSLNKREKVFVGQFLTLIKDVLKVKRPNGKPIHISNKKEYDPDLGGSGEVSGILQTINSVNDQVIPYIRMIAQYLNFGDYDNTRAQAMLADFKAKLMKKIEQGNGVIDLDDITQIFLDSDLSDYAIQAFLADTIVKGAEKTFRDEGWGLYYLYKAAGPKTINRIFRKGGPNYHIFKDLKVDVKDFATGDKKPDLSIVKTKYETSIMSALVNDDAPGGFADYMMTNGVVDGLMEKLGEAGNIFSSTTWGLVFGVVSTSDFDWNVIKYKSKGKSAIKYFSQNVLKVQLLELTPLTEKYNKSVASDGKGNPYANEIKRQIEAVAEKIKRNKDKLTEKITEAVKQ
jgi:hypothetical protein